MSIQLRDRYIPEVNKISFKDEDTFEETLAICKYLINQDLSGCYEINKPRRWGKTSLCALLINEFDNLVLITNTRQEEIRVRRDYTIISPNKYHIHGWDSSCKLVGLVYDWVILDDLSAEHFEELKYYHGLKKYIRIGTHG